MMVVPVQEYRQPVGRTAKERQVLVVVGKLVVHRAASQAVVVEGIPALLGEQPHAVAGEEVLGGSFHNTWRNRGTLA